MVSQSVCYLSVLCIFVCLGGFGLVYLKIEDFQTEIFSSQYCQWIGYCVHFIDIKLFSVSLLQHTFTGFGILNI